ncbi:hypothetical protein WG66_010064 [Moniliophthora roreri]|uniref:Protein-S-isoprenylcysteine O-methyltransferase n=1 Tax=Moniliophthora roreri TaxID=221103 RepID=A0A0W0EYT5_MONRR|nr:hypothetical protein WG66_010064 [Moniliophthora roreri]
MTFKSPEFLKAALKATLVLLSGFAFGVSLTPPNGDPVPQPRPPLNKGLTALREWFLVVLIAEAYPIERIIYYAAAMNEALFILSMPIPFIRDVLPHLNVSAGVNNARYTPYLIAAALLSIVGGVFRAACYHTLGGAFTYECVPVGKRAKNLDVTNNPRLITHGPYAIVRHPSYSAIWMAIVGSALVHLMNGSWVVESGFISTLIGKALVYSWLGTFGITLVILVMRVEPEDEMMKKQFGDQWQQWSGKVRYKLIPWVY